MSVSLAGACGFDWSLPTTAPSAEGSGGTEAGGAGATGGASEGAGAAGGLDTTGTAGSDVGAGASGGSGGSAATCETCARLQIESPDCAQVAASWGLSSGEIDLVESAVETPELIYLWPECEGQDELLECGVCRRCAPLCGEFDSFCGFVDETCTF